jgi:hypothetical protein
MRVLDDGDPQKSAVGVETITIYPASFNRWARTWGEAAGRTITADTMGNIYVTGWFHLTVDFDPGNGEDLHTAISAGDMYLSKFNSNGDFIWARTWGGFDSSCDEFVDDITCDSEGSIYLTGLFGSSIDFDPGPGEDIHEPIDSLDIFLMKFAPNGDLKWARTWPGIERSGWSYPPYRIATDANDNVLATGWFRGTVDFDPSPDTDIKTAAGYDFFFTKFDPQGNHLWVYTLGYEGGSLECWSLRIDGSDDVYMSGEFLSLLDFDPHEESELLRLAYTGHGDAYIVKYTSDIIPIWFKQFGTSGFYDRGISIAIRDNTLYLLSQLGIGDVDLDPGPGVDWEPDVCGYHDFAISKFDTDGNYKWGHQVGCVETMSECAITSDSKVYITGSLMGSMEVDFDPGPGTDIITIDPDLPDNTYNTFLTAFDSNGDYLGTRTFRGTYNQPWGISISNDDTIFLTGHFKDVEHAVDFDPSSDGTDYHTAVGGIWAYLCRMN